MIRRLRTWLTWLLTRSCHWCGSKVPGERSYGMTRPGYVGWRNFCPTCAERKNKRPVPPQGGSGTAPATCPVSTHL